VCGDVLAEMIEERLTAAMQAVPFVNEFILRKIMAMIG